MKIAFFNPSTMAFNVATPGVQPLGGIASCLCYLARSLAARGHDVTLISLLPPDTPPVLMGVRHLPIQPVLTDPAGFSGRKIMTPPSPSTIPTSRPI